MAPSSKQAVIDLTIEPKDHLTVLPPELIHSICDFLFPTHQPDLAFQNEDPTTRRHDLNSLATTCRTLQGEVNSWAAHFLRQHATITKYKDLKTTKLQANRNFLRGKGGLLTWAEKHCIFCGKASSRSAILVNGFRCCKQCDKEQWPDKITKTKAKDEYDLKDHHLLPANARVGTPRQPDNIGRPRYGTYVTSNVVTTMFLEADVRALAKIVHGDFEAHRKRKQEEAEERKRRKAAKEEKAKAAERAWEAKNAPFALAQKEGRSNKDAVDMIEELVRQTGLNPEVVMEGNGAPFSLKQALEMQNMGIL